MKYGKNGRGEDRSKEEKGWFIEMEMDDGYSVTQQDRRGEGTAGSGVFR
jgi:hypothetical protein